MTRPLVASFQEIKLCIVAIKIGSVLAALREPFLLIKKPQLLRVVVEVGSIAICDYPRASAPATISRISLVIAA